MQEGASFLDTLLNILQVSTVSEERTRIHLIFETRYDLYQDILAQGFLASLSSSATPRYRESDPRGPSHLSFGKHFLVPRQTDLAHSWTIRLVLLFLTLI